MGFKEVEKNQVMLFPCFGIFYNAVRNGYPALPSDDADCRAVAGEIQVSLSSSPPISLRNFSMDGESRVVSPARFGWVKRES